MFAADKYPREQIGNETGVIAFLKPQACFCDSEAALDRLPHRVLGKTKFRVDRFREGD